MTEEDAPKPDVIEHGQVLFPVPNRDNHRWRQRGLMVECDSCDYSHGFAIAPDQVLSGIDERGFPVIVKAEHKQIMPG